MGELRPCAPRRGVSVHPPRRRGEGSWCSPRCGQRQEGDGGAPRAGVTAGRACGRTHGRALAEVPPGCSSRSLALVFDFVGSHSIPPLALGARAPEGRSSRGPWGKQSLKLFLGKSLGTLEETEPLSQQTSRICLPEPGGFPPFTLCHRVCSLLRFSGPGDWMGEGGGWRGKEGVAWRPPRL